VLDEEGGVEADEEQPEVDLAQRLVQHPTGQLRPPEVEPGEHRKHHRAEDHVVEVGDNEVGVRQLEVQRRAGQDHPGDSTEQESDQKADRPEHGRSHGDIAAPHRAYPVEELDPGRNGDQERHEGEERQVDRPSYVHVVRPHGDREGTDEQRGSDQPDVAKDGLAAEDGQHFGDDAEERQGNDVDLGVTEEPEQVLEQDRPAVGRVEDVGTEHPIRLQDQQGGGEDRERNQRQDRRDQDVPGEDGHPEHGHAGRPHADDRGDEVDRAQDGRKAGHVEAHDEKISTGSGES
jgi:hypothetical protein